MELKDKPELLIKPDPRLVIELISEIIEDKGAFVLDDSIKEELAHNPLGSNNPCFKYRGIYPNYFISLEELQDFKEGVDQLILKTNATPDHIKIHKIDDILFISLLYLGYSGEVHGAKMRDLYLDELADIYVRLSSRTLNETESDHVWMGDAFTGIETPVHKSTLNYDQLICNDGYKAYSRMIGDHNRIVSIPNDGKFVIQPVHPKDEPIILSDRISKHLTTFLIDYILSEHKKAGSIFYNDISNRDVQLSEWSSRTPPRLYERNNKILKKLILKLDRYLEGSNKRSVRAQRHIFIYNLLALLKLMPLPKGIRAEQLPTLFKDQIQFHRLNPAEKSSSIRTILRDN